MNRALWQNLALWELAVTGVGAALGAVAVSRIAGTWFLIGGTLGCLGQVFLVETWWRILAKKPVALPLSLIVLKYTLFGGLGYYVAIRLPDATPWFLGGLVATLAVLAIRGRDLQERLTSEADGKTGT